MTRQVEIPTAGNRATPRIRDPRLDFFRGIAMFIILAAHVPKNWLALWIPARFGFSDATEIFVFCSGMASALAFGRVFREKGIWLGAARIGYRVWQVYWTHIGLMLAVTASMVALNASDWFDKDYVGQLNLHAFFSHADAGLLGLMTLTYVPNYFDILPMYLVVLGLIPLVVALGNLSRLVAGTAVLALWICAQAGLHLPAEPWSDREWFFNPFGWQLVFFTGFAFMLRWLPAPPVNWLLVVVSIIMLLVTVPLAYYRIVAAVPEIAAWRSDWVLLIDKTDFGVLRYFHFLALAYLAWVVVGAKGCRLLPPEETGWRAQVWRRVLAVIMTVGQQSLAVFVGSMFFAQLLGVLLDQVGRSVWSMFWVNALGFALITGVAYGAAWFKSHPWQTSGTPAQRGG
jgi:hypothetical protein